MRATILTAALLAAAGCDSTGPAPAASPALTLDAHEATSADVFYDLAALAPGERFDVVLQTSDDALRLRTTRSDRGYDLAFEPGEERPSTVTIRYLNDGVVVADPITYGPGEPIVAGTATEGPDSYHYEYIGGQWVLVKDYNGDPDSGVTGGSTTFTTPLGEVVEVTHVEFVVGGLALAPAEEVRLESPRALRLKAQAFGRSLR